MIRERKLELSSRRNGGGGGGGYPGGGDTQEVAATRVAGGTLGEVTQAAVVIQRWRLSWGRWVSWRRRPTPAAVTRTGT